MGKRKAARNNLTIQLKAKEISFIIFIAFLYTSFVAILPNWKFLGLVFFGSYPTISKLRIFFDTLQSLWTRESHLDFWVLIASSILVGLNLVFVVKTLHQIENSGKLKLSVGGITLLSVVTSGCASCGLSILSLLGLSFSFLPFHGLELHVVSILLLIFSLWYMTNKLYQAKYCRVK